MLKSVKLFTILGLSLLPIRAQTTNSDPGGVLRQLTVSRFSGAGTQTIQAITTDSVGNVYVAGTTTSPDLPLRDAAQPLLGDGPIVRSLDRGRTWRPIPAPPDLIRAIQPHPADPQILFAASLDGIYKTGDGGSSWRRVHVWTAKSDLTTPPIIIAIDPENPQYAYALKRTGTSTDQFATSSDGGETWQAREAPDPKTTGSQSRSLWVDPNGSGTVGFGLLLTRDRGRTWTQMSLLPTPFLSFTVPDPRNSGWIYASTRGGTGGNLYLSKDWGVTWTAVSDPGSRALTELLFDPDLPNRFYAGAVGIGFAISEDRAASWSLSSGPSGSGDRSAILQRSCGGGSTVIVTSGRITLSLDFGTSFEDSLRGRVTDLAVGPGCALYAARSIAGDAFVAKLTPGGSEVVWSTFLGGSELDSAAGIAVDPQGNVYVTGTTASGDFPTTTARVGTPAPRDLFGQNVFVTKVDSSGRRIYSVVYGGDNRDTAGAISVNASGEAHVVGWTNSQEFPVTPGAFQTTPATDLTDGFLIKLTPDGRTSYVSFLPLFGKYFADGFFINPPQTIAVATEVSGSVLVGGYEGMLWRIDPAGSSFLPLARQPGQIFALNIDTQGNIYAAGQVLEATSSKSCVMNFHFINNMEGPGDIFLSKLRPDGVTQEFATRLYGDCRSWPTTLKVTDSGELTVGLWTLAGFPMRNPVQAVSNCGLFGSAAVARLAPDASRVLFSSYIDVCNQAAPVATTSGDVVYAGVARSSQAGVLRLPIPQPDEPVVIERATNALSGSPGLAAPGMLLTIRGSGMAPATVDLGLDYSKPLPTQLGDVQVLFDDTPAAMFQVAPDHVICVVPAAAAGQDHFTLRVINGSQRSAPFVLPIAANPGILTRVFPYQPAAGAVDGMIRNADGSVNDAEHPAAPGSVITLYATGITAGEIRLYWNAPPVARFEIVYSLVATARLMPGFIGALYAVDFRIPNAPGDGVYLVPKPGQLVRAEIGRVGNGIGVYVK